MNELDLRCSPPVTDSQSVFQKRAQRGSATADPAQKRARDTRRQLLEAARAAFLERGFGATSVSEIVRRAGVAQGTFYNHFSSKDAVLATLRNRILWELMGELQAALVEVEDAPRDEALVRGLARLANAIAERKEVLAVIRSGSSSDTVEKIWLEGREAFSNPLREILEAGRDLSLIHI